MQTTLVVFPLISILRTFEFSLFWHEVQELLPDEEGHVPMQVQLLCSCAPVLLRSKVQVDFRR